MESIILERGDTNMKVIERVSKYPRKESEHSVWIAKDDVPDLVDTPLLPLGSLIFCAHPTTNPERAHLIAQIWRIALTTPEGQKLIEDAAKEGY